MNNHTVVPVLVYLLLAMPGVAVAQDDGEIVSADDIVKALDQPKHAKTRSITRGFSVQVRSKVDLNIPFEYNSARLAPDARQQLDILCDALKGDDLENYRFEVAGHTDASGSADYNRSLSERRAETVRQYLIEKGVADYRLESVGHGEDTLLLPDNPQHPKNRRVEIRNLGES